MAALYKIQCITYISVKFSDNNISIKDFSGTGKQLKFLTNFNIVKHLIIILL